MHSIKLSEEFIRISILSQILIYGSIMAVYFQSNNLPNLFWLFILGIGLCVDSYKNKNIEFKDSQKRQKVLNSIFPICILAYCYLVSEIITSVYILNFATIIYLIAVSAYIYFYYKAISNGEITFKKK